MAKSSHSPDTSRSTGTLGAIEAGAVYPLPVLALRLGWKAHSIRQARRAGLPILTFGSRRYVLGADAIDFFRRLRDDQNGASQEGGRHD